MDGMDASQLELSRKDDTDGICFPFFLHAPYIKLRDGQIQTRNNNKTQNYKGNREI